LNFSIGHSRPSYALTRWIQALFDLDLQFHQLWRWPQRAWNWVRQRVVTFVGILLLVWAVLVAFGIAAQAAAVLSAIVSLFVSGNRHAYYSRENQIGCAGSLTNPDATIRNCVETIRVCCGGRLLVCVFVSLISFAVVCHVRS
jgi:hypothetical protein